MGRRYDNFTAYFNTFYNATKAFEKGLKSVNQSELDLDRTRYLSIFPEPQAKSGAEKPFDKAVQKSADLLREHPDSKWVDDALLLIGKSYFYQQNYVGALQKFREVIALDAEREGEAQFWLARTLVTTDRYSDATDLLRTALDNEEDYGPWSARMRLVRGQLLVRQEEWEEAERALEQGLDGSLPDDVAARGAFLLGQVRETREDLKGAAAAYRQVPDYSPKYQLEFAARLSAIEMQGIYGDPTAALDRLEALKRGDDTNQMRGEMAVVRARLYQAQGRAKEAKRVLTTMLWGRQAPKGTTEGRIHHELGTLYRDAYQDFTRAAAHFDTAATSLSSPSNRRGSETGGQPQALPRAPSDASVQAERYQELAKRAQTVARMDSLLRLGRMSPSEFQSFVEKLRKKRRKQRRAQARERRRQQFRGQGGARSTRSEQSPSTATDTRGSDAGFLFHQDPTLVQRGRRQFRQTWGDRPLVDNWRRLSAIQGSEATASNEESGGASGETGGQSSRGPSLNLSAVPRDSASQAKMENRWTVARYELANSLFRAAGRPDSAETWYKRILEEQGDHPVAKQALYALAQAHRAQGDTLAARQAYRRVIEKYPDTPFAKRSRQQLGLDPVERSRNPSESKADSAYAQAYWTWQRGDPRAAFPSFLRVAETYPDAAAAPQALLAAGVVYSRLVHLDTLGHRGARVRLDTASKRDVVVQPDTVVTRDSLVMDDSVARPDTVAQRSALAQPDTAEQRGAVAQPDTVVQPDSVARRDTVARTDSLVRPNPPVDSDSVGQSETGADRDSIRILQTRLRKSLDRLMQSDSGKVAASAAAADTTARPGDSPSPDSMSADSARGRRTPSSSSRARKGDTTRAGPQSAQAADSSAGTAVSPDTSASDTTRKAKVPKVSQPRRADSTAADSVPSSPRNGAPRDTTAVPPVDTAGVGQGGGPDSTDATVPERGTNGTDTTSVEQSERTDSTAAAERTAPDSTQTKSKPEDPVTPLKELLTYLTKQYSGSAQAKQARLLLNHLKQRAAAKTAAADSAAAADSVTAAAQRPDRRLPDSTRAPSPSDTMAVPDSTLADSVSTPQTPPADTTASPETGTEARRDDSTTTRAGDSTAAPTEPVPKSGTDSTQRAWTVLARTVSDEAGADTLRRQIGQQLPDRWSVNVVLDSTDSAPRYRLIVGQFGSRQEAERVRDRLSDALSEKPTVWALPAERRAREESAQYRGLEASNRNH